MSTSVNGVGAPAGLPPLPGSVTPSQPMPGAMTGMSSGLPGMAAQGAPGGIAGAQAQSFGASSGIPGLSGAQAAATAAAAGGAQPASGATGAAAANNALSASGEDTFLKLLVAQMKNQDPSSPMDTTSFVTELAQFNSVEQILNLKQTAQSQLTTQQATEGTVLLGRTVTYAIPSLNGSNPTQGQGVVASVGLGNGGIQLQINGQNIPLSQVIGVSP